MDLNDRKKTVQKILVSVPDYIQKVKCDTTETTPPFKCAVLSCNNVFISFKDRCKYPYKFHNFPDNEQLCKTWKAKCGLSPNANIFNLKICSDHFSLDDYIRNYKEEFTNPNFKRKLQPNAVPQKNLHWKNYHFEVESLHSDDDADNIVPDPISEVEEEVVLPQSVEHTVNSDLVKQAVDENEDLLKRIELLHKSKREVEASIKIQKKKIAQKVKEYKKLKSILSESWEKQCAALKIEKNIVNHVFSEAQINLLKGSKKKVFWSNDDLAKAFTLRHMGGKECYLYLKNTLNMPLPALECIQKWAASYHPD